MEELARKYADKLIRSGLTEEEALIGTIDAELVWNKKDKARSIFEKVLRKLDTSSILFARPAEPYRTIMEYLAEMSDGVIYPEDCETRTFLHDLSISKDFSHSSIVDILKHRKGAIIPGHGIVTYGMISPEQAFVTFSSICFALFVKFFSDVLYNRTRKIENERQMKVFDHALNYIDCPPMISASLMEAPFDSEDLVCSAIEEVGKLTVESRLVDSYFGNISYRFGDVLYITQTGSSLDELSGCIDPCPIDGSSCTGVTASSELPAHMEIVTRTDRKAILHGHPKFSVIMSMNCEADDCKYRGLCYRKCPRERYVASTPIVPGEVGTGPFGLCNTVPAAVAKRQNVIVYGHGLFTTGKEDFNEAFTDMLTIENKCQEKYFKLMGL